MQIARRLEVALLAAVACALYAGCVSMDRGYRDWDAYARVELIESSDSRLEPQRRASSGRIALGMSQGEVRDVAGPLVKRS